MYLTIKALSTLWGVAFQSTFVFRMTFIKIIIITIVIDATRNVQINEMKFHHDRSIQNRFDILFIFSRKITLSLQTRGSYNTGFSLRMRFKNLRKPSFKINCREILNQKNQKIHSILQN